jgi:putative tricarboxylic transport membrane protein
LSAKQVGPLFFPGLLAAALALVSLLLLRPRSERGTGSQAVAEPPGAARRSAEVLLVVVSYLALAETLGFVLTAGGLLLLHLLRTGTRPRVALPLALLLAPAAYQLFAVALRVPLPRGLLGW